MKTFNYKTQIKWVFSYIDRVRASKNGFVAKKVRKDIINRLNEVENLSSADVSRLFEVFYQTIKKTICGANFRLEKKTFDSLYKEVRRVQIKIREKDKIERVRAQLKSGDVFFMCSKHYPVAADHKDYQGRLYVHQNWRSLVSGRDYRAVAEYIQKESVVTIQSVMKNPPYLITRPNCRHKLTVVPISAVLDNNDDLSKYRKISHSKKGYNRKEYYTVREECRAILNNSTK